MEKKQELLNSFNLEEFKTLELLDPVLKCGLYSLDEILKVVNSKVRDLEVECGDLRSKDLVENYNINSNLKNQVAILMDENAVLVASVHDFKVTNESLAARVKQLVVENAILRSELQPPPRKSWFGRRK